MALTITLEFSGGAELLFDKQKQHKITLPASTNDKWNIQVIFDHLEIDIQLTTTNWRRKFGLTEL
jgi:hypothetical protein